MSGWPGGPCPVCGENWPPSHLSCPNFCPPPQQVFKAPASEDIEAEGYYLDCPHCRHELRIHRKYVNQRIACNFCHGEFDGEINDPAVRTHAVFTDCPHCKHELRVSVKYLGLEVTCNFCEGGLSIQSPLWA